MGCSDSRPLAAPAAGEEATSPAFAAPSKKPAPPHTYAPLLPATPAPAAPPPPPPYAVDSGRRGAAPRGAEPCPWCHQLPCAHPTAPPPPSPAAPAFLPPSPPACEAEEAAWSLTQAQAAALSRVAGRAARLHAAALPSLHRRGARLGLPPEDVDALLQFIAARAPLVVHCPAVALRAMLRDTHYRNQFETGTSCGTNCRRGAGRGGGRVAPHPTIISLPPVAPLR